MHETKLSANSKFMRNYYLSMTEPLIDRYVDWMNVYRATQELYAVPGT